MRVHHRQDVSDEHVYHFRRHFQGHDSSVDASQSTQYQPKRHPRHNPKPVIAFALTGTQWKVWLRTQWLKNPLSTKYWVPVSRTTTPMSWRGCIFFCDFLRKNISQGSQVLRMITNKVHTSTPPTNKPLASYVSHIHWDDRGTGTPKDRDEVYYEEQITRLCCVLARS